MGIRLESLGDGSPSARNFDKLAALVIDTGGLSIYQRTVAGVVSGAGTVVSGVAFTPARTALGQYTLTFALPFPGIPAITLSPAQLNVAATNYVIECLPAAGGATIHIKNPGVAFIDAAFSFHATFLR